LWPLRTHSSRNVAGKRMVCHQNNFRILSRTDTARVKAKDASRFAVLEFGAIMGYGKLENTNAQESSDAPDTQHQPLQT